MADKEPDIRVLYQQMKEHFIWFQGEVQGIIDHLDLGLNTNALEDPEWVQGIWNRLSVIGTDLAADYEAAPPELKKDYRDIMGTFIPMEE